MSDELDIRPVSVDRLATFEAAMLETRHERILVLREDCAARVKRLDRELVKAREASAFVEREHEATVLAQELQKGVKVRVVCPACEGTGMKPADATSGRLDNAGSAFELAKAAGAAPRIDKRNECPRCEGKRWVIMARFRG